MNINDFSFILPFDMPLQVYVSAPSNEKILSTNQTFVLSHDTNHANSSALHSD